MTTIRLVPSTSAVSNTQYASISNASNMYANTDSTTYGTFTHNRASTSSTYYGYLRGFNFSDVPSNAIINGWTVKIKASATGHTTSTSSSYYMSLVNDTTQIGSTAASDRLSTSVQTFTFAEGSLTWDTIKGYGSNFGVRIPMRRASRNTADVVSVYGAEIEVDYTIPVYHTVSITGDTTPTGSQTVLEGTDLAISYVGSSKPTVTDNNVDVTSQVTESTGGTTVYVPSDSTTSNFTVTNISNAYNDATHTANYASLEINGGSTTGTCYLEIPVSLPSGATLQSVACSVALQFNRNNSSSGFTSSVQMYSGSTAKGSSTTWVSSATDVARTVYNLTVGSWTVSELASARLCLTATNNASSTHRFIYIYGVSLTVTYSVSGKIYTYTLANITADHTVVFTAGQATAELYVKLNGSWVQVQTAYRKVSGSWQQVSVDQAFTSGTNYVKGTV